MIHAQNTKEIGLLAVTQVSTAATAAGVTVDTRGYNYFVANAVHTASATGSVYLTLELQEGDTTSSFATISGAKAGTDYTIPTQVATSAWVVHKLGVPCGGQRKRYMRLVIKAGGVSNRVNYAHGTLYKASESPNTTTESGTVLEFYGG